MTTATNIDATAVNTISWLAGIDATIIVPVYQRQYRWDIGGCEQLLADVRAVADSDPRHMHFIGSILSSVSGEDSGARAHRRAAAHHDSHAPRGRPPPHRPLGRPGARGSSSHACSLPRGGGTKLRPHEAWAGVFESVVFDRRPADGALRDSRFDDNYAFFRSRISLEDAPHIWRGLQKLEHVAITLGAGANAQQIFASLNSTGEPLRDDELIHNYVLMGLSHAEQREIEDEFWLPIEANTGEAIGGVLAPLHGHDDGSRGRGIRRARRLRRVPQRASRGSISRLCAHRPSSGARARRSTARCSSLRWSRMPSSRASSDTSAPSARACIRSSCGRSCDLRDGVIDRDSLIATLEWLQSLLLRRTVAGLPTDRLVARLCRARTEGEESLRRAIARITPSDERMRAALKFAELPHPSYVLARLAGVDASADLVVDHVFPLSPNATWSGDGRRVWADYTDDEQNSHRALAKTIGNLALLEDELALRALDASFPEKRDIAYARSAIEQTRMLSGTPAWGTRAIAARTVELTERFIGVWPRPDVAGIDDDGLTPILDAVLRRGFPRGWEREFAYTEYRGEHWEVPDVKYLFNRVFKRLWADSRESVVRFSARRGGPVYPAMAWNGQWDALDDENFLYMGWDLHYMLTAVQGVLEEAGFAREVFVKYSYIGDAMGSR